MIDPIVPDNFNDGLRKAAGFVGNLLFAVAKEGVAAYVAQMYACEWNIEDKLRIRKVKQAGGKPGFIVFDAGVVGAVDKRLDYRGEWASCPKDGPAVSQLMAEWRDNTEFDSFDEAARIAADVLKEKR